MGIFDSIGNTIGDYYGGIGHGLTNIAKFEGSAGDDRWSQLTEHPERAFLGAADPLSSRAWGYGLHGDVNYYDPVINQWGGPTSKNFQNAEASGIDTRAAQRAHQVAQAIAAYYAGSYGLGELGAVSDVGAVGAGDTGVGVGYDTGPVEDASGNLYNPGGLEQANQGATMTGNAGYGGTSPSPTVAGDPSAGGSEFSNYPGSTNSLDAEPGGNWNPSGAKSSLTNTTAAPRTGGNGVMPDTWQGWAKATAPGAVMGALQLYGNYRKNSSAEARSKQAQADFAARQALMDNPPANLDINRLAQSRQLSEDPLSYLTYGRQPEHQFYRTAQPKAEGGPIGGLDMAGGDEMPMMQRQQLPGPGGGGLDQAFVEGKGGGQEDNIPAMLSPKEYILDADFVSMVGDGNPDEGADRLDHWREQLRKQKRSAPISKIPPKTRPLDSYMRKAA